MKLIYRLLIKTFAVCCWVILPLQFSAQCTFTSGVPYYEGFGAITTGSPLPACWAISNSVTCQTFTSGGNAGFYFTPANTAYFYSNGIQLYSGTTYSASAWYSTGSSTVTNWTALSLQLGMSQSSTGLLTLANVGNPVASQGFSPLSNTFTVASNGIYYLAIGASSNGSCCSNYLTFDDVSVTTPCTLNPVIVNIAASASAVCQGKTLTLTATGADTYVWNNGATTSVINVTPVVSTVYTVTGTNTLTGCTGTATALVQVNPSPVVGIFPSVNPVCLGIPVTLSAFGASTYTWNLGITNTVITLSPSVTTTYSLTGTNQFGCTGTALKEVTVNPTPTLGIAQSISVICEGQQVTLTASGAVTYTWSTPTGPVLGATVTLTLNASASYAAVGTGTNGCEGNATVSLNISDCTALSEGLVPDNRYLSVFPNPSNKMVRIHSTAIMKEIILFDSGGHKAYVYACNDTSFHCDIERLSPGIYYLQVTTDKTSFGKKLVKE